MDIKIEAVVFDMDGLVLDSERLCMKSWEEISVKLYGKKITPDLYYKCLGVASKENVQTLSNFFGNVYNHKEFSDTNRIWMREYMHKNGVPLKKGVIKLLNYLKENRYKIALASSTSASSVLHHLNLAGLTTYFDAIVCGDMVEKSKPNPEIFITACQFLKVNPQNAMGLEDSYNGVRSCSSAGLLTIMVPDLLQPNDEMKKLAYKCVESLEDVITVITILSENII